MSEKNKNLKYDKPDSNLNIEQTRYIYCGPNLTSKGLMQNTVFIRYPEHLKNILEQCPSIKALIVPINELANIKQNIIKKGTYENSSYNEVLKFISEVKR